MAIPGKPVEKKVASIDDLIQQQAEKRENATSPPKKQKAAAKSKKPKPEKQKPVEAAPARAALQPALGRPRSVGGKGTQFYLPDELTARLGVVARELCAGNASYYVRKVLEKALDEDEAKIKKMQGK